MYCMHTASRWSAPRFKTLVFKRNKKILQELVVQIHTYYFLSPFFGTLESFPGVKMSKICDREEHCMLIL